MSKPQEEYVQEYDHNLWWSYDLETQSEELASKIFQTVETIEENQRWIKESFVDYLTLYTNNNVTLPNQLRSYVKNANYTVRYNVLASVIDTFVNRVGSKKIRPDVQTSGAQWELRGRALKMGKYIEGVFYLNNYYDLAVEVLRDAALYGIGYVHTYDENDEIVLERVSPEEITVDEQTARYGKPREMYRTKLIPRHTLQAMYPELAERIALHPTYANQTEGEFTDQIEVIEAFHLAIPGGAAGRHTICTKQLVLVDDNEYEEDDFPIIPFWLKKRPHGWVGIGLAEEVVSLQRDLDKEMARVQNIRDIHAYPIAAVKRSSNINKAHLGKMKKMTTMVEYDEEPPAFLNQPNADDKLNYIEMIFQKVFQLSGISTMSAQAQRPSGDWSGIALRNMDDVQTIRFAVAEQRFGELSVNVGRGIIRFSRKLYKNKSKRVVYAAKRYVETIDWKDANMKDEAFHVKFHPASLLPTTPQGMVQTAYDLLQTGLFTPDQLKQHLDHPDMEQFWSQEQADKNDIQMVIDKMLYEEDYIPPMKFQNLVLGIDQVNRALLRARVEGAPDEVLDLLIEWLDDADALRKELMAEQQQEQQPPQAPPGAPEGAPPVPGPEGAPVPGAAPEGSEDLSQMSPEELAELVAMGEMSEEAQLQQQGAVDAREAQLEDSNIYDDAA